MILMLVTRGQNIGALGSLDKKSKDVKYREETLDSVSD